MNTDTFVTIIQHPNEKKHYKNSGRLLHLCLPNSQLIVTDQLSESQQSDLLNLHPKPLLLYPSNDQAPIQPTGTKTTEKKHLIVLDGTWRKSRRFLHTHSAIATLPRLPLPTPLPRSLYRIRKAETDQQLSTFEATSIALELLEPQQGIHSRLIDGFTLFIEQIEQQRRQYALK